MIAAVSGQAFGLTAFLAQTLVAFCRFLASLPAKNIFGKILYYLLLIFSNFRIIRFSCAVFKKEHCQRVATNFITKAFHGEVDQCNN